MPGVCVLLQHRAAGVRDLERAEAVAEIRQQMAGNRWSDTLARRYIDPQFTRNPQTQEENMPHPVVHFAIHADDVERARAFYEAVFEWRFEAWGPPDFYRVFTAAEGESGIFGALQKRRTPLLDGQGIGAYECTVSVPSLEETTRRIEASGGAVVMPAHEIPGVGSLIQFTDTEGNLACAMQYVEGVL